MGESKLLLALFCNKILTKTEQGVVVVVISWRSGCVTLTVTLQLYRGGGCVIHGLRPPLVKKCHNLSQNRIFSIFQKLTFLPIFWGF